MVASGHMFGVNEACMHAYLRLRLRAEAKDGSPERRCWTAQFQLIRWRGKKKTKGGEMDGSTTIHGGRREKEYMKGKRRILLFCQCNDRNLTCSSYQPTGKHSTY